MTAYDLIVEQYQKNKDYPQLNVSTAELIEKLKASSAEDFKVAFVSVGAMLNHESPEINLLGMAALHGFDLITRTVISSLPEKSEVNDG